MAYQDPQSTQNPTSGLVIPASWGDVIRANQEYFARNAPRCRVYSSGNQSIGTGGSGTALAFNSERFDVGGCHSTSVNTSRLTVPSGEGGQYLIGGMVSWSASSAGDRQVSIVVNGTTVIGVSRIASSTNSSKIQNITSLYALAAGDYVELQVFQDSGGGLDVIAASNYSPEFWFAWQGL